MTPHPRRTVAAYVYRRPGPELLLLKRVPARGGFWQSVTGRVEPTDAGDDDLTRLRNAALRELREETGIPHALALHDLGLETTFTGYDGNAYAERAFAVEVPPDAPVTRCDEHEDHRWAPLDDAARTLPFDSNREALRRLRALLEP